MRLSTLAGLFAGALFGAVALAGPAETRSDTGANYVKLETNLGDIVLELYPDQAPGTVQNFLQYVADGHYDQTIFHRVVPGFVVQGGGYDLEYKEKPTREPIPLEVDNELSNVRGSVAMARTNEPDSATSQFFINLTDNPRLDTHGGGYAVFGRVVRGMDVVDRIAEVPTGPGGPFPTEVPQILVVLENAERIDSLPPAKQKAGAAQEKPAGQKAQPRRENGADQ